MSTMTGASVEGEFYISIWIDNEPLPAPWPAAVTDLKIMESQGILPMLKFTINDDQNRLVSEFHLGDHNQFSFMLGTSVDRHSERLYFRTFNIKRQQLNEGFQYSITGHLDAPKLTKGAESWSKEGTSSEILKSLCSELGLQPDDEKWLETADKQVWINPGISWTRWIQQVQRHSYKDTLALPQLFIQADKLCRFVDMMGALNEKPPFERTLGLGHYKALKTRFLVMDLGDKNVGGFYGAWIGYGYDLHDMRLDGKQYHSTAVAIDVDGYLPLETSAYSSIQTARREYVPNQCGNTHENWWAAYHANLRKSSLFTQEVLALVYDYTDLKLGDSVELKVMGMELQTVDPVDDPAPAARNGVYVLVGKTRRIMNNKYAEGLVLRRLQFREQGKQTMVEDGRGSPSPEPVDRENLGVSQWTYETEARYQDPKDGCRDIVDEEPLPTTVDSTDWDTPSNFTDSPYEWAITGKVSQVLSRAKDTRPP